MSSLSQRGQRLVGGSTLPPYLREHLARVVDEPDHEYPYVCLTVAENKLMWDLLDEKVNVRRGVPPESMDYFVKAGSERFRTAVADFGSEHVWGTTIAPDAIVAMAGAGTVIEAVASVTGDPGDGVLIPTPTYAAYWMDIESRTGMAAVPAPMEAAHDFRIDPKMLQRHFEASDHPIKALLLTNPSNPLGRVHSDREIIDAIEWARSHGLHVIVNELYAVSTYRDATFTSAATLVEPGPDLHLVWGFSKDFGMSGLRAGILATGNDELRDALTQHAIFSGVSGDTQFLLASMLEDADWTRRYIDTMRARLASARGHTEQVLAHHDIPVLEGDAAIFVMADFRSRLEAKTWEDEHRLWSTMLTDAHVNLTPGSACHVSEPGFFRICFASETEEVVAEALDRAISSLGP